MEFFKFQLLISWILIVFSYLMTSAASAQNFGNYMGYKFYDVFFESESQYWNLRRNFRRTVEVSNPGNWQNLHIFVPLQIESQILEYFQEQNVTYQNVSISLAKISPNSFNNHQHPSQAHQRHHQHRFDASSPISFTSYLRFDDILKYMMYLKTNYPSQVEIMDLGTSYEGRDLKAVLIKSPNNITSNRHHKNPKDKDLRKPLILIDAGIHAREWIAHATALYVINQLVENSTNYRRELEMFNWVVWPVINPDGYEYSHVKDRFWRKTRKPNNLTAANSGCVGTDLNRNFDFQWSNANHTNPCEKDFPGPHPFSEPEAVALRNLFFSVNSTCLMYLTLHSYGKFLVYPWSFTTDALPPNWFVLDAVAQAGAMAMHERTGSFYKVGNSAKLLYAVGGVSDGFAYAKANIPIVLCMELDGKGYSFDPPVDEILPIATDAWFGIRVMAMEAYTQVLQNTASRCAASLLLVFIVAVARTYVFSFI